MSPETTLTVMSHKSPQVQEKVGAVAVTVTNAATQVTRVVAGNPVTARRTMFVLNDGTGISRVSQQNHTATIQGKYILQRLKALSVSGLSAYINI